MEASRKRELDPREFEEALVHKFLKIEGFYKFSIKLCKASAKFGHQEALTKVYELYPEVK